MRVYSNYEVYTKQGLDKVFFTTTNNEELISYIQKNKTKIQRCVEVLRQAGLKPTTLIHERIGALCVRVVIKDYIKTYPER